MKRREVLALLGSTAAWPLAAQPQSSRVQRVGVLHPGQAANVSMRIDAIRDGLSGSDNQRSLDVETIVRLADGDLGRLPLLAKDLVANPVEAIIAAGPPAVHAARAATTTMPVIAIDLETDPVASGLITSLARPGGNVTGVFLDFPEFSAKCLQLLVETVPTLTRVGVMWDPSTGALQLKAVEAAAQGFHVGLEVLETTRLAEIAKEFYALDSSRVQGVLILSSPLFGGNPETVAELALQRRIPTVSLFPDIARKGGLLELSVLLGWTLLPGTVVK